MPVPIPLIICLQPFTVWIYLNLWVDELLRESQLENYPKIENIAIFINLRALVITRFIHRQYKVHSLKSNSFYKEWHRVYPLGFDVVDTNYNSMWERKKLIISSMMMQ